MTNNVNLNELSGSFRTELAKKYSKNWAMLADIYARKIMWHRNLMNEVDKLGMAQRVCKDVANLIFSNPFRIITPNPDVNDVIKNELLGRLKLHEMCALHFPHFIGLGDGVMSVYRSHLDGKPAINYIPSYNIIPLSYSNHQITELIWFTIEKNDSELIISAVTERLMNRELQIFRSDGNAVTMVNQGTPDFFKITGQYMDAPVVEDYGPTGGKKFAFFRTGIFNAKWMDTPFCNGVIWPLRLIRNIEEDYDKLMEEYKNSAKRIFISPNLIQNEFDMNSTNGQRQRIKKFDNTSTLFEALDIKDDQIKEWNPQIRFGEFISKMNTDLKIFGMTVGLGHDFYNLDQRNFEVTATQVILDNREAFNTINNMKYSIGSCLRDITLGMIDYWIEDGLLLEEDRLSHGEIDVQFDDGVFVNRAAKITEGLQLYGAQTIDQYTFLTNYCNYTKNEALAILDRTRSEQLDRVQLQLMAQMMAAAPQQEEEKEDGKDAQ